MGKERRERRAIEHTASGVDNTHRRTWDKEEYAEQAEKREEKVGLFLGVTAQTY